MNLTVAGIDQSFTACGVSRVTVTNRLGTVDYSHWTSVVKEKKEDKGRDSVDRITDITHKVCGALMEGAWTSMIDLYCVEGYAYGMQNKSHDMGELSFGLRYSLKQSGCIVIVAPPTCIKKLISGNGNASKSDMIYAVNTKFGVDFTDHNKADAFALAVYGIMALARYSTMTEPPIPRYLLAKNCVIKMLGRDLTDDEKLSIQLPHWTLKDILNGKGFV